MTCLWEKRKWKKDYLPRGVQMDDHDEQYLEIVAVVECRLPRFQIELTPVAS